MFINDIEPFPYVLGIIYLFSGVLFGMLWPQKSWRWGLWIAGPMLSLLLLSTLFAGITRIFLDDVLVLIVPITSACLGSFIGSKFKLRKTNHTVN